MHYVLNAVRGALIGMAELVPGVSGGTVALIVGIYERALDNADKLLKGRVREVEWTFLISIAVGMLLAVFGLSKILSSFVEGQFSLSHGLFFGMVAISIWVPISMMPKEDRLKTSTLIAFAIATIAVFVVTGFSSAPVENPNLIAVFFAASIAICALVLPGVSGSLILLTMGMYQPVIGAVSDRDWSTLLVFMAGALVGLAVFIKVLNYLLLHHRSVTLAVMVGFMLGSLRALWPFGSEQDASTIATLGMAIIGGAIVIGLIFADRRLARTAA